MILLLLACAGEDSGAADSAAADPCADAPHLSWETFGQGFLTEACQTCHASTASDRHGAPPTVTFDTAELAWSFADTILGSATGETPFMPPEGGTTADDQQRLQWWLTCGTPGT